MFSYGNFGYGFSHQLKPLQKLIQPSMFMHIPPPVERTDPLTNVITPQPIEYPAFLSPDLNVTVGTQQKQTNASSPVRLEKLQQQPRDRLDRMKKEYRNLKTWEEKSKYLDQILRMKTETKESPDSKDPEDKDDLQEMDENPLPENLFQTPDLLFKKQEDEPLPSELPVNIPEVKSPPLVEKEAEPSDSSLIIQEDAETKNESLPLEESTPLTPVSLKEKDISVESINGRDDELVLENIEPEEEMTEKEISDSASLIVEPKQSQTDSEKTDSIQSETKLKSIILSPDRKKKSIDESVADPMRQESKRSSEFLQDLKEDIESGIKMSLPRHVSFNISDEGVELPSKTDDVLKIEEHISLDRDKDKDEKKEKDKEGVDEKNETENIETDEEKEIIIRNTYMEDLEDFTFRPTRPENIPIFQGDSSENHKEDIHLTSFKHLEKAKARARFDLGKSPEDNQYTLKNLARPNTAPEFNKRLKENFGKFTSPRVVSAGLFHLNVTNPSLEEYNQKKDLKDLEKCSIICDILQLLNSSYVKRKYEDDY